MRPLSLYTSCVCLCILSRQAVALKALAGVALIGAAAALASNPVLLPISVISGRRRRKRSTAGAVEVQSDNYALTALLQGYIQPKPREVRTRNLNSPLAVRPGIVIRNIFLSAAVFGDSFGVELAGGSSQ